MGTERKRSVRGSFVLAFVVSCMVFTWHFGLLGKLLLPLLYRIPPRHLGHGFELSTITHEPRHSVGPQPGLVILISPERLRRLATGISPYARLVPPGLLRHGLTARGTWQAGNLPAVERPVPWKVVCSEHAGPQPQLLFRSHIRYLTRLHNYWRRDDLIHEEEYIFGHYLVTERYDFREFRLTSDRPTDGPVHRLVFAASGRLRYRIDEDLFAVTAIGRVDRLGGTVYLRYVPNPGGIHLHYDIVIDPLEMDIRKFPAYFDRKAKKALHKSFQRSLNKPKKKAKIARQRLPAWLPMDTIIDIHLADPGSL